MGSAAAKAALLKYVAFVRTGTTRALATDANNVVATTADSTDRN